MLFLKRLSYVLVAGILVLISCPAQAGGKFIFRNNDPYADVSLYRVSWSQGCSDDLLTGKAVMKPGKEYSFSWAFGECRLRHLKFKKFQNGIQYPFEYSFEYDHKNWMNPVVICEFNSQAEELLHCWVESKSSVHGKIGDIEPIWDPVSDWFVH